MHLAEVEMWRNCKCVVDESGPHGVLVNRHCAHMHVNSQGKQFTSKKACQSCKRRVAKLYFWCGNTDCRNAAPTGWCRLKKITLTGDKNNLECMDYKE